MYNFGLTRVWQPGQISQMHGHSFGIFEKREINLDAQIYTANKPMSPSLDMISVFAAVKPKSCTGLSLVMGVSKMGVSKMGENAINRCFSETLMVSVNCWNFHPQLMARIKKCGIYHEQRHPRYLLQYQIKMNTPCILNGKHIDWRIKCFVWTGKRALTSIFRDWTRQKDQG